jgi:hypothetical protein
VPWHKLLKTKVVEDPCFSGSGSQFPTHNPDPEGPGANVLLELWSSIFMQKFVKQIF